MKLNLNNSIVFGKEINSDKIQKTNTTNPNEQTHSHKKDVLKYSIYCAGSLLVGALIFHTVKLKIKPNKIKENSNVPIKKTTEENLVQKDKPEQIKQQNETTTIAPKPEKTEVPQEKFPPPVLENKLLANLSDDIIPCQNLDKLIENHKNTLIEKNNYIDDTEKNLQKLIDNIKPHNYENENSIIAISTRDRARDYSSKVFDLRTQKQGKGSTTGFLSFYDMRNCKNSPLHRGWGNEFYDFMIYSQDNKKIVYLYVPTGRQDHVTRKIRSSIQIMSEGKDFSPIQKDLIDYISVIRRLPIEEQEKNLANIIDLAAYDLGAESGFKVDKDVLLSCIQSAKNMVKNKIDTDFYEQVSKLKDGEFLANHKGIEWTSNEDWYEKFH